MLDLKRARRPGHAAAKHAQKHACKLVWGFVWTSCVCQIWNYAALQLLSYLLLQQRGLSIDSHSIKAIICYLIMVDL